LVFLNKPEEINGITSNETPYPQRQLRGTNILVFIRSRQLFRPKRMS